MKIMGIESINYFLMQWHLRFSILSWGKKRLLIVSNLSQISKPILTEIELFKNEEICASLF